MAHVAFGDIDAALVWQAWHLVTVALLLRGRRGTYLTYICLVDLLFFCFVFLQSQGDGRGNQKRESNVIFKEVNEKTIYYIYFIYILYIYYIYIIYIDAYVLQILHIYICVCIINYIYIINIIYNTYIYIYACVFY